MLWEFVISWDNLKNVVISTQRDNILQFKASYGVSEKCVTPRNFGSGVFFFKSFLCEL